VTAPVVKVGTKLPELSLYGDPTFIVSTAIATRGQAGHAATSRRDGMAS
jgi:hypothetical protein